jgi:hypothetical protein
MMKRQAIPAKMLPKRRPRYEKIRVRAQLTRTKGKPSLARGHLLYIRDFSNMNSLTPV